MCPLAIDPVRQRPSRFWSRPALVLHRYLATASCYMRRGPSPTHQTRSLSSTLNTPVPSRNGDTGEPHCKNRWNDIIIPFQGKNRVNQIKSEGKVRRFKSDSQVGSRQVYYDHSPHRRNFASSRGNRSPPIQYP